MPAYRANDDDTPGFRLIPDVTLRRQLNVSVLVIAMLGVAIMAALFSLDVRPVAAHVYSVSVPTTVHQAAEMMPAGVSKS